MAATAPPCARGAAIEQPGGPSVEAVVDPDVAEACRLIADGNPQDATPLLSRALARNPGSIPALLALAEALLGMDDARSAEIAARRAAEMADRDPRAHALLGDALVDLGDTARARSAYQTSLSLRDDPEIRLKLNELFRAPGGRSAAQLRVRFDGSVNEPLGNAVLTVVSRTYGEYQDLFGYGPDSPVTVVLQTEEAFYDARAPDWAAGLNDGTIRIPVLGLRELTPRLERILRHELAHSFVAGLTGDNTPTWLHEGIAQWLEGGAPEREDTQLASAVRDDRLLPLLSLEGPFRALSEADATLAYAESLSAVAHILRRHGEAGIIRLVEALSDRLPSEEALPAALGASYSEFQRDWEEYLETADHPSR